MGVASRPSYRPLLDLAREETDPFCQWNVDQGVFYSRVPTTVKALVEMIHQHGSWVAIHCHGRLNGVLERIADLGADALHPCEAPPMGDVR